MPLNEGINPLIDLSDDELLDRVRKVAKSAEWFEPRDVYDILRYRQTARIAKGQLWTAGAVGVFIALSVAANFAGLFIGPCG